MSIFRKKRIEIDIDEFRFDSMMSLIKELPRADYNRLKEAMDLGYEAYQKVRKVKTADERELDDIEKLDKGLGKTSE